MKQIEKQIKIELDIEEIHILWTCIICFVVYNWCQQTPYDMVK